MEICPRCGGQLTREANRDIASSWRIDKAGVVISCRLQITELSLAFCPVCHFQEIVSFDKKKSVRPLQALMSLN